MHIKYSVIIPVYNVKDYLHECINSILNQTYKCFELLLIDDGSDDGSSDICDEYAELDERVKVFHQSNKGVAKARNIGIQESQGEFILFVDSDDWLDSNALEIIDNKLISNLNLNLVLFSYAKEYEDKSYPKQIIADVNNNQADFNRKVYRRLYGLTNSELSRPESLEYLSTCWGKVYRKCDIVNSRFTDIESIGSFEDGLFNMDVLNIDSMCEYIDKPLYHYRHTKNSLTIKYRPKLKEQWNTLFDVIQSKIDTKHLPDDFQEAFNNRIALSILGIGMNELGNPIGGFFQFKKYISDYIHSEKYRSAIITTKLRNLPIAWKILLFCSKYRLSFCTASILKAIEFIKTKL